MLFTTSRSISTTTTNLWMKRFLSQPTTRVGNHPLYSTATTPTHSKAITVMVSPFWNRSKLLWFTTGSMSFLVLLSTSSTVTSEDHPPVSSWWTTTTRCDVISTGTPVKEPSTGILFHQLCNGMFFTGCGVRIKYGFVKVYAVATYVDPVAFDAVKHSSSSKERIEEALLDPTYPRTIKIIMNRNLSAEKFTAAIVEALKPRMMGQDLDQLDVFAKLMPPIELIPGAEIEMTIRGDWLLFKNPTGGVGSIHSHVLTKALCDVYYGKQSVSPGHKEQVLEGIRKL